LLQNDWPIALYIHTEFDDNLLKNAEMPALERKIPGGGVAPNGYRTTWVGLAAFLTSRADSGTPVSYSTFHTFHQPSVTVWALLMGGAVYRTETVAKSASPI
jgi:hypothetical protein